MKAIWSDEQLAHVTSIYECGRENVFERPERALSILAALKAKSTIFTIVPPRTYSLEPIERVHNKEYLGFLRDIWSAWKTERGTSQVIPDTFFVRGLAGRKPKHLWSQTGYWCFDRMTPIVDNTWPIALISAACALTGADLLLEGKETAVYALCRPPGHHAHSDLFGGWCYLNNAAIAARHLTEFTQGKGEHKKRRVAVLDVDYHHGNGTQSIFYNTDSVLYVSIHADPEDGGEPHFVGFPDEEGHHEGKGHNFNFPLPMIGVTDELYLPTYDKALEVIRSWGAEYLVVSLGCDTEVADGVGTWELSMGAFAEMGRRAAALKLKTLVVQEGGYNLDQLGTAVTNFLEPFVGVVAHK